MKQLLKKSLFAFMGLLFYSTTFAYDFEVDGIYYNYIKISAKTVAVTSGNSKYTGPITIPSSVTYNNTTYSVTEIGNYAFYYCSDMTSVNLPYSITSINHCAFGGCNSLTSINIPNSVTTIGEGAFEYCNSLTSVNIPNSVTTIGKGAFEYCKGLTFVNIPNSVTSINFGTFYGCSNLTSVNIPNSVESIDDKAFYGCSNLTSINIPNSVTYIGKSAFESCSNLTEANIPNCITSINNNTFYNCNSLTSINIPNSITSIGEDAFYNCSSLTEVNITDISAWCKIDFSGYKANPLYYAGKLNLNKIEIKNLIVPNDITEIKKYTFEGCTSISSITIPNSVTKINDYAFDNNTGLTEIIIEDGIEKLSLGYNYNTSYYYKTGEGLFYDCPLEKVYLGRNLNYEASQNVGFSPFHNISTLKSATIGNSVTTIGDYAFEGCSDLTSATISNSVTEIGNYAFSKCSDLTDIDIPNSVTKIGDGVFSNCTNLIKVTIPNSIISIGKETFYACHSLTNVNIPNTITSINENSFYDCCSLTEITIPNSITDIGDKAFMGCSGLTRITIPNSVTSIGKGAFSKCTSLKSATMGSSITEIGDEVFYNCTSLTYINIPNSVTSISHSAFRECSALASITIGNSVKEIGSYAFENCTQLAYITIPNSVTEIGNYAFEKCSGLISIDIPNSVTSIGENAFRYCTSLPHITIPNSVTSINIGTFYGCSNLTSVNIPNSVTSIGNDAFEGCSNLTEVNIPNSVTSIGNYVFNSCRGLTDIILGNSITSIGKGAFYDCSIPYITIPNSVTSIGENAFKYGDMTEIIYNAENCTSIGSAINPAFYQYVEFVNIGNNVKTIPNYAFYGCHNLTSVVVGKSVETIGTESLCGWDLAKIISLNPTPPTCANKESFNSDNYLEATLYVPKDSYAKYFMDEVWGQFSNIKKIETLVSSIKLNNSSIELEKGSTITLSETISPSNATIVDIVWESSNPQVAMVNQSGEVKALSAGTTTITATAVDGSDISASCNIIVNSAETQISFSLTKINLFVNDVKTLTYTTAPSNIPVKWTINNPNVAYIKKSTANSIKVVGLSAGEATITATAIDGSGASASCNIVVNPVETIVTISQTEANLPINEIMTLSYTITPSNTPVEWSTSNANIAYIKTNLDNSVTVLGVADGEALITATATDGSGASASCKVFVGVSSVEDFEADNNVIEISRYDIHGRLLSEPTKGINIIKYNDGTTRKEVVK